MKIKDYLKSQLKKLNERKTDLEASIIEAETKEERATIGETLKAIKDEIIAAEEQLNALDEKNDDPNDEGNGGEGRSFVIGKALDTRISNTKTIEERAKNFVKTSKLTISNTEARSVLVSSGKIATPTDVKGINDNLNAVSTIIDAVDVVNAEGMGADKVAYAIADAAADETTEGSSYNNSDPTFGVVEIKPTTITVLTSISKQVRKQSPLVYQEKVQNAALKALKIKAASYVIDKITASTLNSSLEITAIDENTLRKIALNYGGENCVIGNAELLLCKKDLVKFGDVRGTNEKQAVYEITPDESGTAGTIKDGGLSVKYRLASITEGTLIYGQLMGFQLDLFSNYEIFVSEDFQFDKGLLTISGDAEIGGDVVVDKGFIKAVVTPAQAGK